MMMTSKFKSFLLTLMGVLFLFAAEAQLISTNNLGNFPPTGPFNPNGKFTALGESGGVPGPTPAGCNLYGFRAQTDSLNSVNLGMQDIGGVNLPTLSFQGLPLSITQTGTTGPGGGPVLGCGKILAWYFDGLAPGPNVVYEVFGSAVATGGTWIPSDLSLKDDIKAIPNAMELVSQLEGVTYKYRTSERPELNLNEGLQYGFVADEVKKIIPEAVQGTYTKDGEIADYDVMNYDMIIPVLTEAIKEQQKTIEQLEERLARLEARSGAGSNPKPSSKVGLNQNRPNPFNGVTTIDYDLPTNMNNAQLVIYDMKGSVLDIFDIEAGKGSIEYNAKSLSSGVYFYSIEANGENLARKKMVIK